MKQRSLWTVALAVSMTICFSSCGEEESKQVAPAVGTGAVTASQMISTFNANSIPREFNPDVQTIEFYTYAVEHIEVSLPLQATTIPVTRSSTLRSGVGLLRVYTVDQRARYPMTVGESYRNTTLSFGHHGNYECSIAFENGQITRLEGGGFLAAEIILPPEAPNIQITGFQVY